MALHLTFIFLPYVSQKIRNRLHQGDMFSQMTPVAYWRLGMEDMDDCLSSKGSVTAALVSCARRMVPMKWAHAVWNAWKRAVDSILEERARANKVLPECMRTDHACMHAGLRSGSSQLLMSSCFCVVSANADIAVHGEPAGLGEDAVALPFLVPLHQSEGLRAARPGSPHSEAAPSRVGRVALVSPPPQAADGASQTDVPALPGPLLLLLAEVVCVKEHQDAKGLAICCSGKWSTIAAITTPIPSKRGLLLPLSVSSLLSQAFQHKRRLTCCCSITHVVIFSNPLYLNVMPLPRGLQTKIQTMMQDAFQAFYDNARENRAIRHLTGKIMGRWKDLTDRNANLRHMIKHLLNITETIMKRKVLSVFQNYVRALKV